MSAAASAIAIVACTACTRVQRVEITAGKVANGQACLACGQGLAASKVEYVRGPASAYPACAHRAKAKKSAPEPDELPAPRVTTQAEAVELASEVSGFREATLLAFNSFTDELLSNTEWAPVPLGAKLKIAAIVLAVAQKEVQP